MKNSKRSTKSFLNISPQSFQKMDIVFTKESTHQEFREGGNNESISLLRQR